jgi:ferric-chelate reductase
MSSNDNVITVSVPVITVTQTSTSSSMSSSLKPVGAAGADPASASSSIQSSATPVAGISSNGPATSGANEEEYDAASLVYHVDLFILALIILLILIRAPRLLARLGRPSNWFNRGHFLRHTNVPRPVHRPTRGGHHEDLPLPAVGASGKVEMASADSHTLQTHEYLYNKEGGSRRGRAGRLPRGPEPQFPVHLSACPPFLRGLAKPLGWRVSPGFSLAQLLVCGVWFAITLYATLYKSTGTFTDPVRAGWVAVAQVPFVFAFASKNNVISGLLGLGYEKLNFMHRFVARLVVLAANVHTLGYSEFLTAVIH